MSEISRESEQGDWAPRATRWIPLGILLSGLGVAILVTSITWPLIGASLGMLLVLQLLYLYQQERRAHARLRGEYEETQAIQRAFISSVSHDLRSPLTAILGFSQLMCDDAPTEPERREMYLATIRKQSEHLARMVEDVVDLARLADGVLTFKIASYDVLEIIENALLLYTPPANRARVQVTIAPGTPPLLGDQYECEQIIDRLLYIALVRAAVSPTDLVQLAVEPVNGEVQFTLHMPGVDMQHEVLQPLYGDTKAAFALGRKNERGLGAAVARALVEAQGGRIRIDTSHHANPCICFTLPAGEKMLEDDTFSLSAAGVTS